MGIIILESGDHLGYVIKKNPLSGMQKRQVRFCELSGMFKPGEINKYCVYGTDYGGCSFSLKNDDDRYINSMLYSSAVFVNSVISLFFDNPLKKIDQSDILYNHSFYIGSLQMTDRQFCTIQKLTSYFENVTIELIKQSNIKSVRFACTNSTLHYFLNVIYVLMTILILQNGEDFDITDALIEKTINCMVKSRSPYFIRYYFSSRSLSQKLFIKFKKLLEQHPTQKMDLFFGNTLHQRMSLIEKKLCFDHTLVDIGCGEGNYLNFFSETIKEKNIRYIGYDIDPTELEKANSKILKKEITTAIITNDLTNVFNLVKFSDCVEVIISEVIEHMELSEVKTFIENIANNIPFKKIIITTPNYEFNKNYNMESDFRHSDHKWELTKNEFIEFMNKLEIVDCNKKYFDIGDTVDEISCTLGFELTKIK